MEYITQEMNVEQMWPGWIQKHLFSLRSLLPWFQINVLHVPSYCNAEAETLTSRLNDFAKYKNKLEFRSLNSTFLFILNWLKLSKPKNFSTNEKYWWLKIPPGWIKKKINSVEKKVIFWIYQKTQYFKILMKELWLILID